ncbi:MAG TPA: SRPBCC family protein, partial [Mucilaginibacter sp.]|nr:SRPBCC family protein [Mucilaginibacter sp.]
MENLSLNTSIEVNAPAGKVWEALTNPEIVKQYFFGTNVKTDWKKGSPIIWEGEWEGKTYRDKGEILDIDPGKFVRY